MLNEWDNLLYLLNSPWPLISLTLSLFVSVAKLSPTWGFRINCSNNVSSRNCFIAAFPDIYCQSLKPSNKIVKGGGKSEQTMFSWNTLIPQTVITTSYSFATILLPFPSLIRFCLHFVYFSIVPSCHCWLCFVTFFLKGILYKETVIQRQTSSFPSYSLNRTSMSTNKCLAPQSNLITLRVKSHLIVKFSQLMKCVVTYQQSFTLPILR